MPSTIDDLIGANYKKHSISQSDVGRELVISISKTNITDEDLTAVIQYLTTAHGSDGEGDSAFTVAAVGTAAGTEFVSGETDVVYLRIQGTGDVTVGTADMGIGGLTVAVVAVFRPRF